MIARLISASLVFLLLPLAAAEARQDRDTRDYPHEKTGVTITIPTSWTVETEGDVLTATTRDEAVGLAFIAIAGRNLEAALEEADKQLNELIDGLEADGEAEEVTLNGMKGIAIEGKGKVDGDEVTVGVLLLQAPRSGMFILAVGAGPTKTLSRYEKDIEAIFGSLKPTARGR